MAQIPTGIENKYGSQFAPFKKGRSCGLVVKAPASEAGGAVFESLQRFGLEVRYDGSPLKRAAISASFK